MIDEAVEQLRQSWMQEASRRFLNAEQESSEIGKRVLEHGAVCYFNCARELNHVLKPGQVTLDLHLENLREQAKGP